MLDTKGTFDHLVELVRARRRAGRADHEQPLLPQHLRRARPARRSTWRPRSCYELHDDARFDLVVVDTPPTRNALDFLEAPARLTRFLDHRLYRALTAPTRVGLRGRQRGRAGLPAHAEPGGRAATPSPTPSPSSRPSTAWRRASGSGPARSTACSSRPETAYVLITAPRRDTVEEARYFARRLAEGGTPPVGRHRQPRPPPLRAQPDRRGHQAARPPASGRAAGQPGRARSGGRRRGRGAGAPGRAGGRGTPMATVPLLATDVHDLDGLAEIADHLFDRPAP